jgi:hypothetical protein
MITDVDDVADRPMTVNERVDQSVSPRLLAIRHYASPGCTTNAYTGRYRNVPLLRSFRAPVPPAALTHRTVFTSFPINRNALQYVAVERSLGSAVCAAPLWKTTQIPSQRSTSHAWRLTVPHHSTNRCVLSGFYTVVVRITHPTLNSE